ncbi:MAG: YitT family protein [Bacteroidetes bacterium]|nr:YitT family protein [Bacteroidota bacterium]
MIPNHFLDGGVTGVSLFFHELFHINLSLLLIVFNLPFIYLAYRKISPDIAIKSIMAIILLSVGLEYIHIPAVTSDKLLISIFGGAIIGVGMGLVIRAGAVIDGMEIVAVMTTKKIGITISEVIVSLNTVLFLIAANKFGIEIGMYAIITYFTAVKAADYIVDGVEEYTALTIIASQSEEIKSIIVNDYKKGITVYKGERGFLPGSFESKKDCDIIVTIVTRLELLSIKNAIKEVDDTAFMYVSSIKEASGGIIKHKSHS